MTRITWLKGIRRIKSSAYTREVEGYRCSACNYFVLKTVRNCPNCGGEFAGKVQGEPDVKS